MFRKIFLEVCKIKNYFVKISCSAKFWQNILNFAKFEVNFAKHKIKNFGKISWNYENKNFAATLLLHNLPSATHPLLPSVRRFSNAVRQCYFEMKTIKEPYFSILSSIILWFIYSIPNLTGWVTDTDCASKQNLINSKHFYIYVFTQLVTTLRDEYLLYHES